MIAGGTNLALDRDRQKSTPTFGSVAQRFLREHGKKLAERTLV